MEPMGINKVLYRKPRGRSSWTELAGQTRQENVGPAMNLEFRI